MSDILNAVKPLGYLGSHFNWSLALHLKEKMPHQGAEWYYFSCSLRMWLQPDRIQIGHLFFLGEWVVGPLPWLGIPERRCGTLFLTLERRYTWTYQLPRQQLWRGKSWLPFESQSRIPDILILISGLRLNKSLSQDIHLNSCYHWSFKNFFKAFSVQWKTPAIVLFLTGALQRWQAGNVKWNWPFEPQWSGAMIRIYGMYTYRAILNLSIIFIIHTRT